MAGARPAAPQDRPCDRSPVVAAFNLWSEAADDAPPGTLRVAWGVGLQDGDTDPLGRLRHAGGISRTIA
ncbi:hypothetical protein GCM10010193_58000 [Kitasatospora atroaurantiaca]